MKLTVTFILSTFLCLSLFAQKKTAAPATKETTPVAPVVKDTLPYDKLKMPIQYVSSGDKAPLNKEDTEHLNVEGPTSCVPDHADGEKNALRAMKMKLYKNGACGFVHAVSELVVDNQGKVNEVKILKVEPDAQRANVYTVFQELQFKVGPNCPAKQTIYQEYKFDIRCDNKPSSGKKPASYIQK